MPAADSPLSGIGLTGEQRELIHHVSRFVAAEIEPMAAEIDRSSAWPAGLWEKIRSLAVTGVPFTEAVGGSGGTFLDFVLMIEQLARGCPVAALLPGLSVQSASAVERFGSDAVRSKYLPGLVTGDLKACWAFTEPATGSDPRSIETKALRGGNGWVITGRKAFISQSSVADVAIVFARTNERLSAFLVDTRQPGFQPGSRYDLLGLRGGDTGDLVLDDVETPEEHLLGEPGDGMRVLMSIESEAKIRTAAMCVGMTQRALDESLQYGLERAHRGAAIAEKFPTVQSLIADIAVAAESSRWLVYHAATVRDDADRAGFERVAATAKLASSTAAARATSLAMQVHGAYGYTAEYPVSRLFRDGKAYEMIQGTAEIQRVLIAKALIAEARTGQTVGS